MLLNDEEIRERIESPINLINRLRNTLSKPTLNGLIPSMPPKAEDVISDLEEKISNTTARSKARDIMNLAMDELKVRMPEIQKPEKLAQIAREMAQVVSHQEAKSNDKELAGKIIVYAPQVVNLENYNIVDVNE
jgi:hypothetical protein